MKKYNYIYLILFLSIELFGQDNSVLKKFEGKVEYISSQFTYVQFGNTEGLNQGDTLFTKKKGKFIPKLIVESLSSRSCATKLIDKPLGVGTEIFGFSKLESSSHEDTSKIKSNVEPRIDNLVKVDTSEFIGFKKLNEGLYGRFSISGYSNISNITNQVDYQNWRYTLSLNADNINDSKISFSNYITFKYRADEWNNVSSNIHNAARIYDLSVKYDFTPTTNILLGRKINRKIQ